MKAVTRFFGGLVLGFAVVGTLAFAGDYEDHRAKNKRGRNPGRETVGRETANATEDACFPRSLQSELDTRLKGKGNDRRSFAGYVDELAVLAPDSDAFKQKLEAFFKWTQTAPELKLQEHVELLTRPEWGLNQAQVYKVLEVLWGTLARDPARKKIFQNQGPFAVLRESGISDDVREALMDINGVNTHSGTALQRLLRLAQEKNVPLTQLRVWLFDPSLELEDRLGALAKLDQEIDKQAGEKLTAQFLSAVNAMTAQVDTPEAMAASQALKNWDKKLSNEEKEHFSAALRAVQRVDASKLPSTVPDLVTLQLLAEKVGILPQLYEVLKSTTGPDCFLNDHPESRLAKLKPIKAYLVQKEAAAKAKEPLAVKKSDETEPEAKQPATENVSEVTDKKAEPKGSGALKTWQDMLGNIATRLLLGKSPSESKTGKPGSDAAVDKPSQATGENAGEKQSGAGLTVGEIALLAEAVPTLVLYENGEPNPKLESIRTAMERIKDGKEDEAAGAVAAFLGTLTDDQRAALVRRAREDIGNKGISPRHRWMAERMIVGEALAANTVSTVDETFQPFAKAFAEKWKANLNSGTTFYERIAQMESSDPQAKLTAIQNLQNGYDKDAQVKWAATHYDSEDPPVKNAARKFLAAMTADATGKPTDKLTYMSTVKDPKTGETRQVPTELTLHSDPEQRGKQLRDLTNRQRVTYSPGIKTAAVVQKPVVQPTEPPANPSDSVLARNTAFAHSAVTGKCMQCHNPTGSGGDTFKGMNATQIRLRIADMDKGQLEEMIGKAKNKGITPAEEDALRFFVDGKPASGGQLAGK